MIKNVQGLLNRVSATYQQRDAASGIGGFLPHLEGLRGVAIILILLFHLGTTGM